MKAKGRERPSPHSLRRSIEMDAQHKGHRAYLPSIPSEAELLAKSAALREQMEQRRSLRFFSRRSVPEPVIQDLIMTASSAPSGANKQPWSFMAISGVDLKKRVREAAEKEERDFYEHRAPDSWLKDLQPFGTDANKPFLEEAPWLIVVFRENVDPMGGKNYYVQESVGIACGFLISAIHQIGLVTLTHTPSPMSFLSSLLDRPANEKPYLLMPVGYPAENATVPVIEKKSLAEVAQFHR
jgi:iodotyrosine deiodinase